MEHVDPRIDAYIAKSPDYAKPILTHLRQLVHQACPEIVETIKWSCPFFDYKGTVCQMVAFKQHMGFGFWKATAMTDPEKIFKSEEESSAGSIGKITSMADLPPDEVLITYIKEAVALNEAGVKLPTRFASKTPVVKPAPVMPPEFDTMLEGNSTAKMHFEEFSPSKQKEYIEWFVDAKTDATRQKRMEQALEWIGEGKSRHWKYQ